jgi:uncharacterized membrane protein
MYLRLEMLRLEALLLMQHLARIGAVTWGLLLVGATLVAVLALAVWEREPFLVQRYAP